MFLCFLGKEMGKKPKSLAGMKSWYKILKFSSDELGILMGKNSLCAFISFFRTLSTRGS